MTGGSTPGRDVNLSSAHTHKNTHTFATIHTEVNPEVYGPSCDLQMDCPKWVSIWPPTDQDHHLIIGYRHKLYINGHYLILHSSVHIYAVWIFRGVNTLVRV